MLVLCVNAGALPKAQGYIDTYTDQIVLMEEGIWCRDEHSNIAPVAKDLACRGIAVADHTLDDRDIVTWIFEQETTIVV